MQEGKDLLNFVYWTKLKIRIHLSESNVYFREKEIWWMSLGVNIGNEQDGKHDKFERPVLILKKFNRHLFLGVPLSSKVKENIYYYKFKNNENYFCAILSQLKAVSSKRLLRKIGMFPDDDFIKIKERIKNFL
jgi:mRNA interferase MazF